MVLFLRGDVHFLARSRYSCVDRIATPLVLIDVRVRLVPKTNGAVDVSRQLVKSEKNPTTLGAAPALGLDGPVHDKAAHLPRIDQRLEFLRQRRGKDALVVGG